MNTSVPLGKRASRACFSTRSHVSNPLSFRFACSSAHNFLPAANVRSCAAVLASTACIACACSGSPSVFCHVGKTGSDCAIRPPLTKPSRYCFCSSVNPSPAGEFIRNPRSERVRDRRVEEIDVVAGSALIDEVAGEEVAVAEVRRRVPIDLPVEQEVELRPDE